MSSPVTKRRSERQAKRKEVQRAASLPHEVFEQERPLLRSSSAPQGEPELSHVTPRTHNPIADEAENSGAEFSEGNSFSSDADECVEGSVEQFGVHRILQHRCLTEENTTDTVELLVLWEGRDKEKTWEPASNFLGSGERILELYILSKPVDAESDKLLHLLAEAGFEFAKVYDAAQQVDLSSSVQNTSDEDYQDGSGVASAASPLPSEESQPRDRTYEEYYQRMEREDQERLRLQGVEAPKSAHCVPLGIRNPRFLCWAISVLQIMRGLEEWKAFVLAREPAANLSELKLNLVLLLVRFLTLDLTACISTFATYYIELFDDMGGLPVEDHQLDATECLNNLVHLCEEAWPGSFSLVSLSFSIHVERSCGHSTARDEAKPTAAFNCVTGQFFGGLSLDQLIRLQEVPDKIDGPVECTEAGCTGDGTYPAGQSAGRNSKTLKQVNGQYVFVILHPVVTVPIVRSLSLSLPSVGGVLANYRLIEEVLYVSDPVPHYVTVRESGERLWLFDDGSVHEWTAQKELLWSPQVTMRTAVYERSNKPSLFHASAPFTMPTATASDPALQLELEALLRAARFVNIASRIKEKSTSLAPSPTEYTCKINSASTLEEMQSVLESAETSIPLDPATYKEHYSKMPAFCDTWLKLEKDLILSPPVQAAHFLAVVTTHLTLGIDAALRASDTEALDIALATFQASSVLLWRPTGDFSPVDFVRIIALRCIVFITEGPDAVIEAMMPAIHLYQRDQEHKRELANLSTTDEPKGFNAKRAEMLIKNNDCAAAVTMMLQHDVKFLHVSEETRQVLQQRFAPKDSSDLGITREQYLGSLEKLGAKPAVPTVESVKKAFTSGEKGSFKKHRAAGPSGWTNLHFSCLLAVPQTRDSLLKGFRALFAAYFSPFVSEAAVARLYYSKGAMLKHKSGVVGKLKVIMICPSETRMAQKMVPKMMSKLNIVEPALRGVQNALLKDGVTLGPMTVQAMIDLESKKAEPNKNIGFVTCDMARMYATLDRSETAKMLIDFASKSKQPKEALGIIAEFGNHCASPHTQFGFGENKIVISPSDGVSIGGASSTLYACIAVAPAVRRTKVALGRRLLFGYSFADNNGFLMSNFTAAPSVVSGLNEQLKPLGLNCPKDSFHLHIPLFEGTEAERAEIVSNYPDFKVSFGIAATDAPELVLPIDGLRVQAAPLSDLSGLINEGVPLGTLLFREACLQRVNDTALKAIDVISRHPIALSSKLALVTKCILPTVGFQYGVAEVHTAHRLALTFHAALRGKMSTLLDVELSDAQFDQVCLPVCKFGGFGLNSPRDFAVPSIIRHQLSLAKTSEIFDPNLTDAISYYNLSVGTGDRISIVDARHTEILATMQQKELTGRVHQANFDRLLRILSPEDSLRLQTAGAAGSGLWLHGSYSDFLRQGRSTEQVMTEDAFRIHVGLRLVMQDRCMPLELLDATHDSQFIEGTRCGNIARSTGRPCTAELDTACVHPSSCCKCHKYDLHNCVTDALDFIAGVAGLVTTRENLQVGGDDGVNKRVDTAFLNRPKILIDVTARSPFIKGAAPSVLNHEDGSLKFNISFHVKRAEEEKSKKYLHLAVEKRCSFKSFVISSTGQFGSEAHEICSMVAEGLVRRFFIAYSEAMKITKRFIQTTMMQRMAEQIAASLRRMSRLPPAPIAA